MEVTPEVTPEITRVLFMLQGECSRQQLQDALGLRDDEHFRKVYLLPALDTGLAEMTIPNKPRSSKQRYRLTALGLQWRRARVGE
jgi:ATP-dependent DNA helicase RecG